MTSKRGRLTLAERAALSASERPQPLGVRHCWVSGLPEVPGRWPGLLVEWSQRQGGEWFGRVVYGVDEGSRVVLVETWVAAVDLDPVVSRG